MENKEGFIRLVEAAVMILIIMGLLLTYLSNSQDSEEGISQKVYEAQQSVLREIQLNDSLRNDVLSTTIDSKLNISGRYEQRLANFYCESKVCSLQSNCPAIQSIEKDVYSQEVMISSDLEEYNPRKLKIFCWEK